jgi:hypothetical protein
MKRTLNEPYPLVDMHILHKLENTTNKLFVQIQNRTKKAKFLLFQQMYLHARMHGRYEVHRGRYRSCFITSIVIP